MNKPSRKQTLQDALVEIAALRARIAALEREKQEQQILLESLTEHSDSLQAELLNFHQQLEQRVADRTAELEKALNTIQHLSGLIPIRAWCGNKIQNEDGTWSSVEKYIEEHSEATFTHGICPDCLKKLKSQNTGE